MVDHSSGLENGFFGVRHQRNSISGHVSFPSKVIGTELWTCLSARPSTHVAFKGLVLRLILQCVRIIAYCRVLHRLGSQDIHRHKLYMTRFHPGAWGVSPPRVAPGRVNPLEPSTACAVDEEEQKKSPPKPRERGLEQTVSLPRAQTSTREGCVRTHRTVCLLFKVRKLSK